MKITKTQLREIIREELQSLSEKSRIAPTNQSIPEDTLKKLIKVSDIMKWKMTNSSYKEPERWKDTAFVESIRVQPKTSHIIVTFHRYIRYAYSMGEMKMIIKETTPERRLTKKVDGVSYKARFTKMKDELTAMYKITQE